MKAKSFVAYDIEDLKEKLEEFDEFKPSLAIVFNSIAHDISKIQDIFNQANIPLYGATTAGEIVDDGIYEQSIAVMLTDMSRDYYEIFFREASQGNDLISVSKVFALRAKELFAKPNLIINVSGHGLVDGDFIIYGIMDILGKDVSLFGGVAGDDLKFTGTWVYTNDKKSNNAVIGLIINGEKVKVEGLATSGWTPLGDFQVVNNAKDNIVYEIGGKPAVRAYIEYYGLPDDVKEAVNILGTIGARYPLLVYRWGRTPVLRSPVFGNPKDLSLTFAGKVPQNSKVKFTVPPTFEIMEETIKQFQTLKDKLEDVDFLLMFSCKARHIVFNILLEDEVKGVRAYWNSPMIGFFTYGEFGVALDEMPDYHNETCTVVGFKEIND